MKLLPNVVLAMSACMAGLTSVSGQTGSGLPQGRWDAALTLNQTVIPFRLDVSDEGNSLTGTLYNVGICKGNRTSARGRPRPKLICTDVSKCAELRGNAVHSKCSYFDRAFFGLRVLKSGARIHACEPCEYPKFVARRDDQANVKPCNFCAAFSSKVRVSEHPLQIPSEPISACSNVPVPFRRATTAW